MTSPDPRLLLALQRGIPIEARPFARIGADLGMPEEDVIATINDLLAAGTARRFGAIFNPRALGYESTLCAVNVPAPELDAAVGKLIPHPGITHCYERGANPNLWFTLTAAQTRFAAEISDLERLLAPHKLLNLPAIRRFKVEVIFDTATKGKPVPSSHAANRGQPADTTPITPVQKEIVRTIEKDVPVVPQPFARVAEMTQSSEKEVLELLSAWHESGRLRRIALILRHRKIGFTANGMCTWRVPVDGIEAAGQRLAACPEVTHCYQRPLMPEFPYNLFAMIHAHSEDEARGVFEQLSDAQGLGNGQVLISTREFKKSSPHFFQ